MDTESETELGTPTNDWDICWLVDVIALHNKDES